MRMNFGFTVTREEVEPWKFLLPEWSGKKLDMIILKLITSEDGFQIISIFFLTWAYLYRLPVFAKALKYRSAGIPN